MFALVGGDGVATEYASPAEGRDGELYTARLLADPAYVEVDFETREPLKPAEPKPRPAPVQSSADRFVPPAVSESVPTA
jgi:hypothetical protein